MPALTPLEVAWKTHQGMVRERNEDSCMVPDVDTVLLQERGYLFAVADGMGGYGDGHQASRESLTTLYEQFYSAPITSLPDAIQSANMAVRRLSMQPDRDARWIVAVRIPQLFLDKAIASQQKLSATVPDYSFVPPSATVTLKNWSSPTNWLLKGQPSKEVGPGMEHRQQVTQQSGLNSSRPIQQCERSAAWFTSAGHAQRFLSAFTPIASSLRPQRHLLRPGRYRQEMKPRLPF
jgi:hypothetical protein